ncbi:hypothetical protein METBIDRAFT_30246 [Metschnikowia bicuspidata var. bicuspidata NRRL YB-4993]|uniref:Mitochondrial group I intron splicing factor CCM1 n=1 Tax=Metschnikowia bicuspidata var. bicuspidata NRRL YB-4993 TaxID=869754 RepID=A0A1A0HIN3_9ASCO|nr:hypothetical protein METBIDRAFT_30246 [Metschnikowia bicuspidata var. bicuspidata NRRL YB-4993]OBA23870.1 hypothetical protein METBIDRAFT_30246 [Metschnikowia bicuspidata var. bicuspidata NRRL YB-4993]
MWPSLLKCLIHRYRQLLSKPVPLAYTVGPRRHKWMFAKSPSRDLAKHGQVIVEEQKSSTQSPKSIIELKHYFRTRDLSKDARMRHLRAKMEELVGVPVENHWADDYFTTIDAVFMSLHRENGVADYLLPKEDLFVLFDKTARFYLDSGRSDMPQYMAILALAFTKSDMTPPTSVLVNIVEIGSRAKFGGLSSSLSYVLQSRTVTIGPDFIPSLLERQAQNALIILDTYESLLAAADSSNQHRIVNDEFVRSFISHVQEVFADSNPKIHEYLDENRNLHRIQYISNKVIHEYLKAANTQDVLRLLKLKADLNSVHANESDIDALETIMMHIQAHGEHDNFSHIQQVLFTQDIDDEEMAQCLLSQAAKGKSQYDVLLLNICDFVIGDEIKFSSSLRLQSLLWKASLSQRDKPYHQVFPEVKRIYDPFANNRETASNVLSDVLRATSTFQVSDTQGLLDLIYQNFVEIYDIDLSIMDYKLMIDRFLEQKDLELAYSLFQESIEIGLAQWVESADPSIAATLDNLVISLFQTDAAVADIFSKFKKVKQHMPVSCSADALHAIAQKMLAECCVGDVMELMKRELPAIEKDSYRKIRTDLPYCSPYDRLFHLLHQFVVTYKEDTTFQTNWVLYGEMHKYFHIPAHTYLPVIKFFCETGRLNAALLIVRRMKMLSELHADSNINPPPQREIYVYLLKVFGDQLYEEGVVEIHEFLKMDTNIQTQDIHMQNSILNAYSNLQNIGKARDLFLTISSNPKQEGGINEETAQIMLKTYTYSGLPYVKKFWNSLSLYGIFPDYGIYKQYLIAHTYHGDVAEAIKLVEEIDDYNLEFSSDLLLSMHNYCIEPEKQAEVVDWAKENHKEKWEDLIEGGLLKSATPYMPDTNLLTAGHTE